MNPEEEVRPVDSPLTYFVPSLGRGPGRRVLSRPIERGMYPASLGSDLTWELGESTHPDRVPRVRFTAIFESMDGVVIARIVPALFVLFTWILKNRCKG